MKSYKLIKEYPGSPKLGTIFDYWTDGISEQIYNKSNNPSFFPLKIVTDYSEFWEEIVEKDYEILSIYSTINGTILSDSNVNTWESKINTRLNWEIHSVKRLSDGEVFTVGDKTCENVILGFYLTTDKQIGVQTLNVGLFDLNKIKKLKKPLFTTEDGVDVYEGDKISTVLTGIMELYTINGSVGRYTTPGEGFKYFSTKEAAEDYILCNKPCLSLNDLLNTNYWSKSGNIMTKLKQLVKSKL